MYKIFLYSNDRTYPHFPGITYDWAKGNVIRYEKGEVVLDKCAGVRYDTQIAKDGKPLTAFCSKDPYYFYRTRLAINELGEPR